MKKIYMQLILLSSIIYINFLNAHSLALKYDRTVLPLRYNDQGQLSNDTGRDREFPLQVRGLCDEIEIYDNASVGHDSISLYLDDSLLIQKKQLPFKPIIAAGGQFSLVICDSHTVMAFGINNFGQLGNGSNITRKVPTQVSGITGITAITAGYYSSLALKNDGTVWAWGHNPIGQLGNGTRTDSNVPMLVSGLTGITTIASQGHSLALKNDGTVWAWGANYNGELGVGNNSDSNIPKQVSGLTGIIAIAAGRDHSLAVKNDGTVWTWGDNLSGQLGNGIRYGAKYIPVQVNGLTDIIGVAGGVTHSIALKNDGTVWAWGKYSQLGNGNKEDSYVPVQVSRLTGVTSIASGYFYSLALKSDGTVWAWGDNSYGELGNGIEMSKTIWNGSSVPIKIKGLTGIIGISGGYLHSLALKNDGTVWAWGYNSYGQLGNDTKKDSNIPVEVIGTCKKKEVVKKQYNMPLARSIDIQSRIELKNNKVDTINIKIYDNEIVDQDSISLYLDDSLLIQKQQISFDPIILNIPVSEINSISRLKLVAESLGSSPPCTAKMIVTIGQKYYEIIMRSNFDKNAVIELFLKD